MVILVMVLFTARVMVVLTSKNAQVSFQRQFVAEVMRCEETERRLRLEMQNWSHIIFFSAIFILDLMGDLQSWRDHPIKMLRDAPTI